MIITCNYCKSKVDKPIGHVNRAKKHNLPQYCNKLCAGLGRRLNITVEEKKKLKAEYDKEFRAKNNTEILKKKKEYHKRTYDPIKAAVIRKIRMPKHVEYCRQTKYKEYKKKYDHKHRLKEKYGEFWEAASILVNLNTILDSKQIKLDEGLINKTTKRKRIWKQNLNSLPQI